MINSLITSTIYIFSAKSWLFFSSAKAFIILQKNAKKCRLTPLSLLTFAGRAADAALGIRGVGVRAVKGGTGGLPAHDLALLQTAIHTSTCVNLMSIYGKSRSHRT